MKSFIKKQNIVALLLIFGSATTNNIIHASQKPENCNSNSTPTNIEKEFDMLIDCARYNPNVSWFRKGGWECGKYFLPLSNDKANFKKAIAATDFSEEGQRIASEFIKKHDVGFFEIYRYIQKRHDPYNYHVNGEDLRGRIHRKDKISKLATALQDQNVYRVTCAYHNPFLQYAGQAEFTLDNLFSEVHFIAIKDKQLPIVIDKQDQENIIKTINRHQLLQIQLYKNQSKHINIYNDF